MWSTRLCGCRMASRASDRLPARSRGCTLGEGVLQLTSEASPSARVLHVTQATEIRRRISMDHAHPLSRESGKGKGKGKGRGRGGDRGGGGERGLSLFSKYPPLPRVRLTCRLSRLRFRRPLALAPPAMVRPRDSNLSRAPHRGWQAASQEAGAPGPRMQTAGTAQPLPCSVDAEPAVPANSLAPRGPRPSRRCLRPIQPSRAHHSTGLARDQPRRASEP